MFSAFCCKKMSEFLPCFQNFPYIRLEIFEQTKLYGQITFSKSIRLMVMGTISKNYQSVIDFSKTGRTIGSQIIIVGANTDFS